MATATLTESTVLKTDPLAPRSADPAEHYEVVNGAVVEELPLGAREVWIASRIARALITYDLNGELGTVLEEMLFVLKEEPRLRRRPDLAWVSAERWPTSRPAPLAAAWNVVPDLAVEIVSPTDLVDDLMSKIEEYFHAGVRLVWVVYPCISKLYVYDSARSVHILDAGDDLSGGAVLPGFKMPLNRIFVTELPHTGPIAS